MTARNADASAEAPERDVAGLPSRKAAFETVARLLGRAPGLSLDDAMAEAAASARLSAADLALARAIATATFRQLGFLRAALGERMRDGLPADQRLLALLATGAVQILDLAVPDHAAVDLSVRLAKSDPRLAHLAGLVNAVLRRISREREAILDARRDPLDHNTPAWLAKRWRAAFGEGIASRIAEAHLQGAALDLTVREGAAAWGERLGGTALALGSVRLSGIDTPVPSLPGYGEGAWWVQDAAAAIPARLLDVGAGERVADLCAAPGGKTAQLASAGARVTAVDRSGPRLKRLRESLTRLGLDAEIQVADVLDLDEDAPFDAVLLDAPCSATGTIRRHPDVAWIKSEGDVSRLAGLQRRLLDKAARLVKPGGRLVYCTCSLEPEEGERQVQDFLARHTQFERIAVTPAELGGHGELIDGDGDLRALPCHLSEREPGRSGGLDGFFASKLRRHPEVPGGDKDNSLADG